MCYKCKCKSICSIYGATGGVSRCEHVVEDRHGTWIAVRNKFGDYIGMSCSECGRRVRNGGENFCPNCGTDMR